MPGGLYDQNPIFLDRVLYIMGKEGEEEARRQAREKRTQGNTMGNGKALRAGRRRGR